MRIKIIARPINGSDITHSRGIKIVNAETGELVENVRRVKWECGVGEIAIATLEFVGVECETENIIVQEKTCLGDEYKSYVFTKVPEVINNLPVCACLNIEEHLNNCPNKTCTKCNDTGKIEGFLSTYDCECKTKKSSS